MAERPDTARRLTTRMGRRFLLIFWPVALSGMTLAFLGANAPPAAVAVVILLVTVLALATWRDHG